ncbi:MAG: LemA family protein, partial [Xanthomonadaceae bacterium]|nr:LemA family protein [Xanthomonadaceae bacterium]
MSAAIVLGVIAILIISVIKIHNGIINRYNATVRAWADVVTEERNKNQLFPEIERLAESFKEHEGSV